MEDVFASTMLYHKYLLFGREGTVEGDPEGLFDYIDSRVGTSYENTGLKNKSISPSGFATVSDFADYLLDIIKYGKYEST
jgi:hypothetical protein